MTMTFSEAKRVLEDWNNATAEERAVALKVAIGCLTYLSGLESTIGEEIKK